MPLHPADGALPWVCDEAARVLPFQRSILFGCANLKAQNCGFVLPAMVADVLPWMGTAFVAAWFGQPVFRCVETTTFSSNTNECIVTES